VFERPASGERALLVQLDLNQGLLEERLSELRLLVESAGASVEGVVSGRRARPDPALFVGSGKADEIGETLRACNADLVVFCHALSPGQQRNLERVLQCRVVDRTALILDIFALRARSHEGKLRWNWPSWSTCRRGWCAAGLTSNGRRAALVCEALARPSWRPTGACSASASRP
jgi:GTP-binding protein HflX